jgi:hypothetical protein
MVTLTQRQPLSPRNRLVLFFITRQTKKPVSYSIQPPEFGVQHVRVARRVTCTGGNRGRTGNCDWTEVVRQSSVDPP